MAWTAAPFYLDASNNQTNACTTICIIREEFLVLARMADNLQIIKKPPEAPTVSMIDLFRSCKRNALNEKLISEHIHKQGR
jgi:hypothetical protein